jgi:uncharacterized protein with von Willebrand factor type A (vWA) domain
VAKTSSGGPAAAWPEFAARALPPPRLFQDREARLAALDALPRPLWLGSMINAEGRVEPRLAALHELAGRLVQGGLPATPDASAAGGGWPDAALGAGIVETLQGLQLPAYCEDKPELAQQVISSLLWHLDHIVDYQDRGQVRAEAVARALGDFADDWSERCGLVDELTEVFGDLGDLPRDTQWGDMLGLLKTGAWQDVVRIRRLLERLPELARLIRGLGRSSSTEDTEDVAVRSREVAEPAMAPVSVPRPVRVPDLPGETRGVRRSGRVARMLPAETLLLAHPRLRLIWHARHAERALLTYEDDDSHAETSHDTALALRVATRREPERRREMGPMLVCIDTSGSMQGGAEAVAKACALEAARTAHAQGRACHLFAFGGPGEVVETSLKLDAHGIRALTEFLGQGFRGGTDICGPIERAIERLQEAQWKLADLVIASDGDFGATPPVAAALDAMKTSLGVRVQGVLIGDRETIGLLELADDVFWVRDWRRYGSAEQATAPSPVHSKSLTAEYFPGALRGPAHAPPTVNPAEGAKALWPTPKIPRT